jgi:hypothetical protein
MVWPCLAAVKKKVPNNPLAKVQMFQPVKPIQ